MASEDQGLEDLTTVLGQVVGRLADNAPEATEAVLDGMSASERRNAEQVIATGRWNNRRG